MAKASLKNISTAKKKPVKRRAVSLAVLKLGDEPFFIQEPTAGELVRALNWYTQCADDPEVHKAWVYEFLAARGWSGSNIRTVTAKIKKMIGTYIFLARMFNRNIPLDIKYDADALVYFEQVLAKHEEDLDEDGNPVGVKTSQKKNTSVHELVIFIEDQIDAISNGARPESVYQKLQANGCNAATANQLKNIFKFTMEEFTELSRTYVCDEQLEEAYSHLNARTKKALGEFMRILNDDLSSFAKVATATRKPRKKKPVKVEKLVSRVKYKAKDDTYKIASVSPDKIIGASWLWVFNTKYRTIQFYEADTGGLSVKGTTVQNYKSCGQKKLRKPEEQLSKFTSGAVKALPKHFELIKTAQSESNGRINEDTVLLRVFA